MIATNSTTLNPTPNVRSRRIKKLSSRIFVYLILIGFAAYFLMPFIVMLLASFKNMNEVSHSSILSLPLEPTWQPWRDAWNSACFGTECTGLKVYYWNTLLMVIPAVIISTIIGAINGYALSKFKFKGSNIIYGLILFGSFAPFQVMLIPIAKTLAVFGLSNSIIGLIILHTVYGLPITTMFFRNYFVTVPQDLVKAAQVDGAGFWMIFRLIMLPLSIPMIVVTVIWQFTGIWNDFLFGVSFTSGSNSPIMVALNNMVNTSTGARPYNIHMAGAILAALPTLVVYVLAGKYFVRGLMAGAVKG
ncbi:carbohydrate ABC transporter permease [Pectobacterium sp. A5351]|uniref:carbohydrate ABC transporter permease n=1 Tax=Pectobacterium sp. A5351 TaxID=2914983 RepID=UPI00232BDC9C|nr:carbohydrate ABC transporter permease [Pectobacterium sp. A5351]WCG85056.1 carbohydrate ABC transporter permease [Pectobacterium sp. A5351]